MNKPTTILLREQSWQDFLIAKNIEMSKKMSDILSNTIKVIISFFVALFLNKILSIFRKRQLYLSCWNSLENTSISDNACTINASIYNNGKEKEKNVVIQIPSGMECSALSCNYDYKNDSGKIIIDRVLPGKKLSLIILIEFSVYSGLVPISPKTTPSAPPASMSFPDVLWLAELLLAIIPRPSGRFIEYSGSDVGRAAALISQCAQPFAASGPLIRYFAAIKSSTVLIAAVRAPAFGLYLPPALHGAVHRLTRAPRRAQPVGFVPAGSAAPRRPPVN